MTEKSDNNIFILYYPNGIEIQISYNQGEDTVNLFIESEEYKLDRGKGYNVSGDRYANNEGNIVFWEHQGEAMVEIIGKQHIKDAG